MTGGLLRGPMRPMAKPVKCERCGRENDPSFAFCLDCGRAIPPGPSPAAPSPRSVCLACGSALLPGFRFCGQCGAPAGATPVPRTPSPPHPTLVTGRGKGLRLASVRTDGAPGPVYPLDAAEVLCGRADGDIRIADDGTVSPRHARFTVAEERLTVEDLGSVNGTFVRIRTPHRLSLGEEIRVGRQLLRVEPLPRPPGDGDARAWGAPDPGYKLRLAQLLDGGGLGEIHPLREGENVIGREAGEVVFPGDRYVSARHAQIEVGGETLTLSDLGSSNGTFRRIAGPTVLEPGDQLLVGAQLLKVEA